MSFSFLQERKLSSVSPRELWHWDKSGAAALHTFLLTAAGKVCPLQQGQSMSNAGAQLPSLWQVLCPLLPALHVAMAEDGEGSF